MKFFLLLFFAINLFAFETYDQIQILNDNIYVKKSGYIVTKKHLTPEQAFTYFKEDKTLALPQKIYNLNNDYTSEAWLFYQIQTDQKDHLYLDVIDPYADYCTMYTFKNNKLINKQISGNAVQLDERSIKELPVRFKMGTGDNTYLIHIKAHISTFGGISVGEEYKLNQHWHMLYTFAAFVSGVFISLFFYNLFLLISTKDSLYLYYLLYTLGFYGIVSITIGMLPFVLGHFGNFYLLIFTGPATKWLEIIGLSMFSLKFLELSSFNKKVLYTYLIILTTILVIYLLGFPSMANIMFPLVACFSMVILYLGISSYLRGYKPAKYFIAAMGVASILTAVTFLAQVGLVPMGFINNNISSIALMWDMPMLSFALAYRIKLLQEQNTTLQNEQKANAKFIATGELIGSIAHQWRQPLAELSSIVMKIKAKVTYDKISPAELNNFLDEQDKVLKRMSNIIEIFNKTSSNNQKEENFHIEKVLEDVKEHYKHDISLLNIDFEIHCENDTYINGYKNIFIEVFLILLNNSIYSFRHNTIRNPKIITHLSENDVQLVISIEDNAGGINIQPIEKIFDPYFTTKKNEGIGLGLYLAKKNLHEYFHATIDAVNTRDGAKFTISLPISTKY